MIRLTLTCLCLVTWFSNSAAQDAAADATKLWEHGLTGSVAMSQVAFKDWAQGGESALAWTLNLDGKSERKGATTDWTTSYKAGFGQTRQGDRGFRKTDDKIDIDTVLIYKVGTYINPFVSATLKTQFANGITYDANDVGTVVSRFFDPAYLTQSAGVGYQPLPEVKTRLGAALRETSTRRFTNFSDSPSTLKIEDFRVDGGLESVTNVDWNLAANIIFKGKLEIFQAITGSQKDPIVRTDTTLVMSVNKYISANINVQVLRDKLSSPDTQIKQTLSVGLNYSVF
ncbi:MAG: DUF3078 domain-containing protein [Candidatus Latescibacteria bacterium]|nr:DUF3078 domain-containing protein [Candidatus Latescibacterota bacterium]